MASAAPATPPTRPALVCRVCHREGVPVVADGKCWRDYQRARRARKTAPDRKLAAERLDLLAAAYGRVTATDQAWRGKLAHLRSVARLAYADGLSTFQLAPLVDREAQVVHRWLDKEQTAARHVRVTGRFGGDHAPDEVVDRWAPVLLAAADDTATAKDHKLEAAAAFRELLAEFTSRGRPGRVRPQQVAERLEISDGAVGTWLHRTGRSRRCEGRTASGARCRLAAPKGHRTCGLHRDQE